MTCEYVFHAEAVTITVHVSDSCTNSLSTDAIRDAYALALYFLTYHNRGFIVGVGYLYDHICITNFVIYHFQALQ